MQRLSILAVLVLAACEPVIREPDCLDAGLEPDAGLLPTDAGAPDAGVPADAGVARKRLDATVRLDFPAALKCGERVIGKVTVVNTGTETWTRAAEIKLGANDDSDDLAANGRFDLADGEQVRTMEQRVFELELTGPATPGAYVTDWRMVQEFKEWFGELGKTTVTVTCPVPVARKGRVRVSGTSLVDDDGPFNAVGASLFWAAWAYKNDKPKLEAALKLLRDNGFDFFRAFGTVGHPTEPDSWDGREIDWRWPDYAEVIKGVTDLAYDKYGLRVQWTLIADGQSNIPVSADRYKLLDTFHAMSLGREHKIILFEIANEYYQNGFGGSTGLAELRALTSSLNARTEILVAASAPTSTDCTDVQDVYAGGIANVATIHFSRDTSEVESNWGPVRQPWVIADCNVGVASNNEPIGPGSSVVSEPDRGRINAAAITSFVSNVPFYVFHSTAGVRGQVELSGMAGIDGFKALRTLLPPDLSGWTRKNGHWADSPFRWFAGDAAGALTPDVVWPDLGSGATSGVVRAYSGVKGDQFFSFPIGIKGRVFVEPRRKMEFDIIDPLTGAVLAHKLLDAGVRFELNSTGALALVGSYR